MNIRRNKNPTSQQWFTKMLHQTPFTTSFISNRDSLSMAQDHFISEEHLGKQGDECQQKLEKQSFWQQAKLHSNPFQLEILSCFTNYSPVTETSTFPGHTDMRQNVQCYQTRTFPRPQLHIDIYIYHSISMNLHCQKQCTPMLGTTDFWFCTSSVFPTHIYA